MIKCILNELSRDSDRIIFKVTFFDQSGSGIANYRVEDVTNEELAGGELDCPRTFDTGPIEVTSDRIPILARSTECDAAATDSFTNTTPFDFRIVIPVEPEENPCDLPETVRMEEGTPSAIARQTSYDIAEEIELLCEEWRQKHENALHHEGQRTVYGAAMAGTLVAATTCVGVGLFFPWVLIAAAALFVVALALGAVMSHHRQEADRSRREMEELEAQLEEARERYYEAVEEAIRASCGLLPAGMALDPPEC